MTEELKPCPFCGGSNLTRDVSGILCGSCGTCGPINYDDVDRSWNTRSPAWRDDMEGLHKAASEVAAAYWDIDQDGPDSPCVKLLFDRMKALTDVLWELRRENPPHPIGIPLPPEEGRG